MNKTLINNFIKNGISVLKTLSETELISLLKDANKAYYNDKELMTDSEYDIIYDYFKNTFPNSKYLTTMGAPIENNEMKVVLPYKMPSMDKIKPDTKELKKWMTTYKGPYVISYKLDGVSALYTTEGDKPKLYTRGNGSEGQDISHIIPYLLLPITKGLVLRGELIMSKNDFDSKYKTNFANPRNMIPGIIKQKILDQSIIRDIKFVAYEVIKPLLNPSLQMTLLHSTNINTVHFTISKHLSNEYLSKLLVEGRSSYLYEMDGIIVTNDQTYERNNICKNPEHSFAFKMVLTDQIAEVKVLDVLWNVSKDGYLKPRIQIEPVYLKGVLIEYATGFNAAFIRDNKIGVGSIIELIRSGDVIPFIRKVITPSSEPKMPSISYVWNETGVDILVQNIDTNNDVKTKVITLFFEKIGVDGLSSGNITRIIAKGFDTITKILEMSQNDFMTVDGFKDKTATKLYEGIKYKIQEATLVTLMTASNVFGRGFSDKKIELILKSYPDVIISNENENVKKKRVMEIKGMAEISANAFVENIPKFIQFMHENHLSDKLMSVDNNSNKFPDNSPLFEKSIVMTGFRDNNLENKLKKIGAKVSSSVSKNTFVVLVKIFEESKETGKLAEAKKIGLPIMLVDEFRDKYNI
jgi:NAD-dependent DNA ligase